MPLGHLIALISNAPPVGAKDRPVSAGGLRPSTRLSGHCLERPEVRGEPDWGRGRAPRSGTQCSRITCHDDARVAAAPQAHLLLTMSTCRRAVAQAELVLFYGRMQHLGREQLARWWSQTGSNRRPPACKAGALPAELWPRSLPPGTP